jgi:hypothetical protein
LTLRAFNAQHLARVPRALLRDDSLSYAVYSFEPGEMRPAAELTRRDVEAIAAFTADLLRFSPQDLAGELAPAVDASFSPTGTGASSTPAWRASRPTLKRRS